MAEEFDQAGWANSSFQKENTGNLIILFHPVQKELKGESLKQGRPVFKEFIHITKIVPGDQKLVIDRPLRESDKEEFADRWEHFQRTQQNKAIGFPIDNWHSISDTQKAELKAMKFATVEQLSNMSDAIAQGMMGGADIRRKAQLFLEAGKDAELLAKVREESDAKVATLTEQVAKLTAMLEQMTAPQKQKAS